VPDARRRQDAFVTALLRDAGGVPWSYQRADEPPFAEAEVKALSGDESCDIPRPSKSKLRSAGGPKAPLAPTEKRNADEDRSGAGADDR
jgi:hypothetical protein